MAWHWLTSVTAAEKPWKLTADGGLGQQQGGLL